MTQLYSFLVTAPRKIVFQFFCKLRGLFCHLQTVRGYVFVSIRFPERVFVIANTLHSTLHSAHSRYYNALLC